MTDGAADSAGPRLQIASQFTREMTFENLAIKGGRSPASRPNISVKVDADNQNLGEGRFIVAVLFEIDATDEQGGELFKLSLDYAGLVFLTGVPEDKVQAILSIDCMRYLFPYARQVISDATRNGGFPPLLLEPINFAQLYAQQSGAAQPAGAEPDSSTEPSPVQEGEA